MIHLHWEECDALLGLLRALRYDDRSDELELELVDQARGVVERLRAGVLLRLSREECQALLEPCVSLAARQPGNGSASSRAPSKRRL